MANHLLKDTKITRVANSAVAAQSEVDSSILDMAGYDGVIFIAALGDVTANCVLTLKVEQNTANSTSGMAALTGNATFTAGATDADNKMLVVDVIRPKERYVRAALTRTAANAVVDGIFAIQYKASTKPVTADSSVLASATIVDAAEA